MSGGEKKKVKALKYLCTRHFPLTVGNRGCCYFSTNGTEPLNLYFKSKIDNGRAHDESFACLFACNYYAFCKWVASNPDKATPASGRYSSRNATLKHHKVAEQLYACLDCFPCDISVLHDNSVFDQNVAKTDAAFNKYKSYVEDCFHFRSTEAAFSMAQLPVVCRQYLKKYINTERENLKHFDTKSFNHDDLDEIKKMLKCWINVVDTQISSKRIGKTLKFSPQSEQWISSPRMCLGKEFHPHLCQQCDEVCCLVIFSLFLLLPAFLLPVVVVVIDKFFVLIVLFCYCTESDCSCHTNKP